MASKQFYDILRLGKIQGPLTVNGGITANVNGNVTGGVTGNVIGNVTGNLAGNVTGNVVGNVTGAINLPAATVAAAGDSQATAAAVAAGFTLVSAANDEKGVRLPAATAGAVVILKNAVADKFLAVYPATGDKIDGGSANAAVDMDDGSIAMFVAYDATDWYSVVFTAHTP
jgi:hypothetical protein